MNPIERKDQFKREIEHRELIYEIRSRIVFYGLVLMIVGSCGLWAKYNWPHTERWEPIFGLWLEKGETITITFPDGTYTSDAAWSFSGITDIKTNFMLLLDGGAWQIRRD